MEIKINRHPSVGVNGITDANRQPPVLPVRRLFNESSFEPPHDKTNKMSLRPAKTQISLGIRPVWSVFAVCSMGSSAPKLSSCGQRRLGSSAQADPSLRWAHMPFCWFCHEATHFLNYSPSYFLFYLYGTPDVVFTTKPQRCKIKNQVLILWSSTSRRPLTHKNIKELQIYIYKWGRGVCKRITMWTKLQI